MIILVKEFWLYHSGHGAWRIGLLWLLEKKGKDIRVWLCNEKGNSILVYDGSVEA